jgi:hypothetical protein
MEQVFQKDITLDLDGEKPDKFVLVETMKLLTEYTFLEQEVDFDTYCSKVEFVFGVENGKCKIVLNVKKV